MILEFFYQILYWTTFDFLCILVFKLYYSVACEEVMNAMGCSLIQWEYEGFPKIIPERGSGQRVDFVRT